MYFSDVIGQDDIKARLIHSVQQGRVPHAQLLTGPEGVGKLRLALAYAQYICCENRSGSDSCGICPSCLKYQKLEHPDLHFVFPVIKPAGRASVICDDFIGDFRKMILGNKYFGLNDWLAFIGEDAKQGLIYANESEEILRKLSLKTYESDYKVMIIWLPEKMNIACANKLLKILEEPPEKTLFLLVSNAPDEIIATILSRTQQIKVSALTPAQLSQALLRDEELKLSETEANFVARIARGSYLNAIRMAKENDENKINFDRFVQLMRLAWQVGNRKDHAALKTLRRWSEDLAACSSGREGQKNFLAYSQRMIRENFVLRFAESEINYMAGDESDFAQRFSPFIHERNVEELMDEFDLAERHIEQNVSGKMVFFDLALKTIMLLKK